MRHTHAIGVDLGGTNIALAVVDRTHRVLGTDQMPSEAERGPDHVIARIADGVASVIQRHNLSDDRIAGVGIGTPGPLDLRQGLVVNPANLPGWGRVPLPKRVSELTGFPAIFDNDANVATYGEFVAGAGKGTQHMAMYTLGTGVGGGVIVDGKIVHGHFDNAGESGHVIVNPGGRQCACGQLGCLEAYSSAGAVAARVAEEIAGGASSTLHGLGSAVTCEDVAGAARQGDQLALRIWNEACYYLGVACIGLQHLLNPERIVLGGGMAGAGDQLLDGVREHMASLTWKLTDDRPEIVLAALGPTAGAIGAAALVFEKRG